MYGRRQISYRIAETRGYNVLDMYVWKSEGKTIKRVIGGRIIGKRPIGRPPNQMERCCGKRCNNDP